MGAETFLIVVPPRLGSSSPRHLPEKDEPPRRCVSIVLWYRFCRVGSTTTYSRRPIRRYGRYHRLIVSCLHLWCDHTCARHLSHQKPGAPGDESSTPGARHS